MSKFQLITFSTGLLIDFYHDSIEVDRLLRVQEVGEEFLGRVKP